MSDTTPKQPSLLDKLNSFVTGDDNNNNQSGKKSKNGGNSGGGGSQNGKVFGPEIKCHTGCNKQCGNSKDCASNESPRLQYGVFNDSAEVDFNVTVTIPRTWTGVDSATLQVGGVEHKDGCNTDGYKAYVGINGGDNGIGTETGIKKKYHDLKASCPGAASLQPGQTYQLRMLKRILARMFN